MTSIADSIKHVREKIEKACDKAGRDPEEVTLVAVTKTVEAEKIKTAIQYGLKHFGENYVQEARTKIDHIGNEGINWHMIGYVQTNKVKYIQGRFDFIHSVDRWELLENLEKYGRPIKALFELNLSREATKHGMDEDGLKRLLEKVGSLQYIKPVGLMTMAPYVDDPERVRTIFSTLRKTLEKMNSEFSQGMKELSMGMSSDFEVAIEEGATMVRVGTALFGEKNMKPWGGRFKGKTDPLLERFSASIDFDRVLYEQDIAGSKAHAQMLEKIGILTAQEKNGIVKGLDEIEKEIKAGKLVFDHALEDIHMHIETRLIEKIGNAGKKLHTGRSRNDQVSLDMRLFLKKELAQIDACLLSLLKSLVQKASKEGKAVIPGYTHMQRAQAVPFAHYLMAYYAMFKRDRTRLHEALTRVDVLPLGSGALAGSTIPLDREFVARKLGFAKVSGNSMDTVADRDFVLDAIYVAAMIMLHLSRFSEDLILFATEEFSFITLPDELCTGSSLMPHKKNPDALELIRGKTSRVMGDLFSIFSLLKGLPLTYNRDLQEDKEPLFHAVSTVKDALSIMELCVKGMALKTEHMKNAVSKSFMPAVEMAEYLTTKGIPFRDAHAIVGKIVRECENKGKLLCELSIKDLKKYSSVFDDDVFAYMDSNNALNKRKTKGAASFKEAARQINEEKIYLNL